jgi:hypothetical protein
MKHLRELYDTAFREWTLEMSRLQQARQLDVPNLGVLEAERRSAAAEAAYRATRDRLAEALGATGLQPVTSGV